MSIPQDSNKDGEQSGYFGELLKSDPDNPLYKRLASIERPRKPFRPFKLPEIENLDPLEAGRAGECDAALDVLIELYPEGTPYRLTTDGTDFAHVFLMFKGQPMDIGGTITVEELRAFYHDATLKPEPVNMQDVRHYFNNHRTHDESRRYRELFRKHVLVNVGKLFPPRG